MESIDAAYAHKVNWIGHYLSVCYDALRTRPAPEAADCIADTLCTVTLDYADIQDPFVLNAYELSDIFDRMAKLCGKEEALEVVACVGLMADEGSPVHDVVRDWYVKNRPLIPA